MLSALKEAAGGSVSEPNRPAAEDLETHGQTTEEYGSSGSTGPPYTGKPAGGHETERRDNQEVRLTLIKKRP